MEERSGCRVSNVWVDVRSGGSGLEGFKIQGIVKRVCGRENGRMRKKAVGRGSRARQGWQRRPLACLGDRVKLMLQLHSGASTALGQLNLKISPRSAAGLQQFLSSFYMETDRRLSRLTLKRQRKYHDVYEMSQPLLFKPKVSEGLNSLNLEHS